MLPNITTPTKAIDVPSDEHKRDALQLPMLCITSDKVVLLVVIQEDQIQGQQCRMSSMLVNSASEAARMRVCTSRCRWAGTSNVDWAVFSRCRRTHIRMSGSKKAFRTTCRASGGPQEEDFVRANGDFFRALPLGIGASSFVFVLVNRAVSGLGLVADARSSQSRVDVICIVMSATLALTGLSWLSLKPRVLEAVEPDGVDCLTWAESLSQEAQIELQWVWESFRETTRIRSIAVFQQDECIFLAGKVATDACCDVKQARAGPIVQRTMDTGQQSYLANLVLYPGRVEFVYFPKNTQAIFVQPMGNKGAVVVGVDTIRGLTSADQAWLSVVADKLEVTLENSGGLGPAE